MLTSQDAPSLTALTFAAAVARAAGNTEEERRLIDQALAVDEADDPDVRLEVIDFISTSGHAAEAVELLEQRLKEAPDDDFAVDLYGTAIERAYATASADETAARERAAVHRFADRTGLVALRDAVSAFLDGTELGDAVQAQVTEELSVTDDLDWLPEDRVAFGKLAGNSPCLPWTPGRTRTRRRTISGTCCPMMIPQAPRCGCSGPIRQHRRRWRPGPWPGTNTSTTACGGSMIRSRAGPAVHRYRLRHRAVRRVPRGSNRRTAAMDGVAGRHSAGGRDLAQHRGGGQAQPGGGRRGGGVHR